MFEQVFGNVDDVLRREAGCTTELDYTEQTSWVLFLKYLDALDEDRATEARQLSTLQRPGRNWILWKTHLKPLWRRKDESDRLISVRSEALLETWLNRPLL